MSPENRHPAVQSPMRRVTTRCLPTRPLACAAAILSAAAVGLFAGWLSANPDAVPAVAAADRGDRARQAEVNRADLATVHVPIINYEGQDDMCLATISAQNVGNSEGKVVLVTWAEPDIPCGPGNQGPLLVECSGLLRPGSAWRFANGQTPTGAKSGVLFSLGTRRLSEVSTAPVGEDQIVADWVCHTLAERAVGKPEEYAEFAIAFEDGEVYRGVYLDQAAGPPLAVTVSRRCPGDVSPQFEVFATYEAAPNAGLGMPDPTTNTFAYLAGPLYVDDPIAPPELPAERMSFLTIQNAGTACASVEIQLATEGECGAAKTCGAISLAPGESAFVDPADCAGSGWRGTAWIESNQPLAIEIDSLGADGLSAYTGVPLRPGFAGVPVVAAEGGTALYTPVIVRDAAATSGEIEVVVQNLAVDRDAHVRLAFFDPTGGAAIEVRRLVICPLGSGRATFASSELDPATFGSIRAESLPDPANPAIAPAPISAVAELRSLGEAEGEVVLADTVAVNLLPEAQVFDWPNGGDGAAGGTAGAALLAWPEAARSPEQWSLNGELVISNAVPEPGYTDVAVLLYDQNALLSVLCRRLGAGASAYIDLQQSPGVIDGFFGSALVSATAWTHSAAPPAPPKPLVGLTALMLTRFLATRGTNRDGDELAAALGQPLPPVASPGFEGWRTTVPLCPGDRLPSPRPTAGPDPRPGHPGAGAAEVHVPTVNFISQDEVCVATLEATNRGPESAIVIALLWTEPGFTAPQCTGVFAVQCSGLLEPGDTWRFVASGNDLMGSLSASFYSFNTRTLDEIGVQPGSGALAAETLCRTLAKTLVGTCPGYPTFGLAFRSGGTYAGLPLDRLVGPPIGVTVLRDCEADRPVTVPTRSQYAGIPHADTTAPHPGTDPARGAYAYSLSHAVADRPDKVDVVYFQNAGLQPTRVSVLFRAAGAREPSRLCAVYPLAPSETYQFETTDCIETDWEGSLVIRADQPLAVLVDELRPEGLRVHGAFGGDQPFDLNGDGKVDLRDLALLDGALGAVPGSPRWKLRYDLIYDDALDLRDRDWLIRHLDPGTGTPPPAPPLRPAWSIALPWVRRD